MCVVSAVMDDWSRRFPTIDPYTPYVPSIPGTGVQPWKVVDPSKQDKSDKIDLTKMFKEFKEAMDAAKKQDIAEGNPDCVDPDKAKLLDRIKELENLLATKPEFVLVKGANLEPGKYRVLDGVLYKVYE